ncbi:MAG TPA: signal recognition particle-docking protein FtsY [Methanoregulaceae archaeon]|jgi:fused signal recognition particle receptor|nr:signal recognition particle-docking protein FtsY [Methanolinea sp.]MCC7567521.1 signal recognition particle-docking protein FtsY [Methanoregulaceae archaeon]MDD3090153.1 signal recognition particle-docking protein FtsY [Methanoregulaceae archaeon]MDD5047698.1 signal recognition particle-docking protein FtsY [Methanoregulaceae archaeon]MDD5684479.1 signal recognition particle-docking protein FtsY [Methanoregulaceae archaeon]
MFEGLRSRLQKIQGRLEENIETASAGAEPASSPRGPAPAEKGPGMMDRVKVLVTDREFFISEDDVSEPLFELEMVLLESDVALPVTEEIISLVRQNLTGQRRKIGESVDGIVFSALRDALMQVLGDGFDLPAYIRGHDRPVKILFTGVNGTGKTTTVAKIASFLKKNGFSVVIGAGDTFRAGAIEQIDEHARRLGIKIIQHQHGADPSAVLFDAVQYASAHNVDVVLADTAGRFHNRANLMNQLDKIRRVMKPDLIVYVDEAVAGNDAVVRAHEFEKSVGADAVILTKADMDSRGGAAISIAHTIGKPLMFLGVGQGYDDIMPFEPAAVIGELFGGSKENA